MSNLTFAKCEALWKSCRCKPKGKPVGNGGRLFKRDDGAFELKHWGEIIVIITSDDVAEFQMGPRVSQSAGAISSRLLGFEFFRQATGKYRVHASNVRKNPAFIVTRERPGRPGDPFVYFDYNKASKEGQLYFQGLKVNLATREFVNGRPDPVRTAAPDAELEWKRKLAKFRKAYSIAAKMGAMDHVVDLMLADPNGSSWWSQVHHYRNRLYDPAFLHRIIVDQDMVEATKCVIAVYWSYAQGLAKKHLSTEAYKQFNQLYSSRRDPIRKLAGCYVETQPDEAPLAA